MSGLKNTLNVLHEYIRQANSFGAHTGAEFPFGSKVSRKVIEHIAESGKVDISSGSLKEGLRLIDEISSDLRKRNK